MEAVRLNGHTEGDGPLNLITNGVSLHREEPAEVQVPMPWGYVTGRWWGPRNKQPIIAIHGWQDNAGTWDALIPMLPSNIAIYAIDMPGHGLSSPYPPGTSYYIFWDGIIILRRIVKHFHWSNITLMGHSMGGALSFMYAACFPDEVYKYISVDIAGPPPRIAKEFIEHNGPSIDKFLKYENLTEDSMPSYTYDEMLDIVHDAYKGSVNLEGCKILMKRGMSPVSEDPGEDKHYFRRDVRLKVAGLAQLSLDAVLEYAKHTKCKVLNIRAKSGLDKKRANYLAVIEELKKSASELVYVEVEGTHHVHLNEPEKVADVIIEFLQKP